MYVIRVVLKVRESETDRFEAHAREEAAEVPGRFAGCARYGFHAAVGEAGAYLLYEEWSDRESFEAYRRSEYFTEVGGRLRPLLAEPPDSAYYEAERAS